MSRLTIAGFGTPGFVKDIGAYVSVPEAFDEVQNFRFNSRGAVSFGGYKEVLAPANFNPLWLKMFPPLANPKWVYAGLTKVGLFDSGHYDITRIGSPYNAIAEERWAGDLFSGVGIFNNTQDVPQAWLQFNATPLVDLPNWPANLLCKFIRPFKQFLIAGNLTNTGIRQPYRIRWSHPADPGSVPASWVINDPAIDAGEFDIAETSDELIDGMAMGNLFIVYKQKSTHALQFIGGNDIFFRDEIISNKGMLWRDCVQPIPEGHFVVGADDIYLHSGRRGSERSLIEDKLREWVFNQISADTFFNCFTVKWEKKNEVWFCFPEAGATYPTIALVYNTVTHGIGVKDLPNVPFMYPGPVSRGADEDPIWGKEYHYLSGNLQAAAAVGLTGAIENAPYVPPPVSFTLTAGDGGTYLGYREADLVGSLDNNHPAEFPWASGSHNVTEIYDTGSGWFHFRVDGIYAQNAISQIIINGNTYDTSTASFVAAGGASLWEWNSVAGIVDGNDYDVNLIP